MKKQGNGTPEQCAHNLLHIMRGEVPYSRAKGINARLFDKPSTEAVPLLEADAITMLGIYEPRVDIDNVRTVGKDPTNGLFELTATGTVTE